MKIAGVRRVLAGKKDVPTDKWDSIGESGKGVSVVLTYSGAWDDLFGEPDVERKAMFESLLCKIGWPKTSCAVVPFYKKVGAQDEGCPDRFWQTCSRLSPKNIIVFGPDLASTIFPDGTSDNVIVLPDPGPMSRGEDNAGKRETWERMKRLDKVVLV